MGGLHHGGGPYLRPVGKHWREDGLGRVGDAIHVASLVEEAQRRLDIMLDELRGR